MERDSFIFYRSFASIYEIDDVNIRDRIIYSLIRYALDGKTPELTGIEKAFFEMMRPQIDANNKRYENGCKGAEYGKLGGRPRKENALQCNENVTKNNPTETRKKPQNNPTETRNDNVNVNVNDNVNDTSLDVSVYARTRAREDTHTFAPPTVDEIAVYAREIGKVMNAQRFYDFYESKGWTVGNQSMRDWKACMRLWEPREGEQTNTSDDGKISKDAAADKAAECKQRLLESDPEFYENEKALRLAQLRTAKGETVPLGNLLAQRYIILSRHNLTWQDIGDDYSAEATQ